LDLVSDLHYFFSNPNPNPNPAHSPEHQTLSPNHQFSQCILICRMLVCACAHDMKSEISLNAGIPKNHTCSRKV